jgi:hypothetical protein
MPYVSMGAMFNPKLAALLKDRQLPPDLTWLAPMGPWAAVARSDDDGLTGYSRSGVGNQGILIVGAAGGTLAALQMAHLLPHQASPHFTVPVTGNPNASASGVTTPAVPIAPATPLVPPSPSAPPTPSDANSAPTPPAPASTH